MTEQELRDEFEKWANKVSVSKYNEVYFVIFKSGYLLAQEKIKAKDATITEARELIEKLSFYTKRVCGVDRFDLDLKREYLEKAKAWLENNK